MDKTTVKKSLYALFCAYFYSGMVRATTLFDVEPFVQTINSLGPLWPAIGSNLPGLQDLAVGLILLFATVIISLALVGLLVWIFSPETYSGAIKHMWPRKH